MELTTAINILTIIFLLTMLPKIKRMLTIKIYSKTALELFEESKNARIKKHEKFLVGYEESQLNATEYPTIFKTLLVSIYLLRSLYLIFILFLCYVILTSIN